MAETESGSGSTELQGYQRSAKRLIRIINEIRALGGQAIVDLPRIAVIGNQSAGKSSLIEAISNITVPRAMGTCTRCPMECRLQQRSDAEWHAQVSLRLETDRESRELREVKETSFGGVINSKEELEKMLRRAQLAILNPTVNSTKFVDLDLDTVDNNYPSFGSEPQLAFSSNVVCVAVTGPDVPDLTFIDLPGIIQNEAETGDGSIKAVQDMVMKHIQGNCLILLTISMRDDIENQSAVHLAKQVDPEGRRTVGVLTKPDTIQDREEDRWLDILEGRLRQLSHGYYMTKQPAPADLEKKITHAEARQAEKDFFNTNPIWSRCPPKIRARMGTSQLGESLSRLLSGLIDKTLPGLRKEVRAKQQYYSEQIASLPEKLSQPAPIALLGNITKFTHRLEALIEGNHDNRKMIQECNVAFREFRTDIRSTAPIFVPKLRREVQSQEKVASENAISAFGAASRTLFRRPPPGRSLSRSTPILTPTSIDSDAASTDANSNSSDIECSDDSDEDRTLKSSGKFELKRSTQPMYLDDIRQTILEHVARELPYNVPFNAKLEAIKSTFKEWNEMAGKCADTITKTCRSESLQITRSIFGRFQYGELDRTAESIVDKQIIQLSKEVKTRLEWQINMETTPYTQNLHYFSSYRDKYLTRYKSKRQNGETNSEPEDGRKKAAVAALRAAGYLVANESDLERFREPDQYEQELIVAAEVRAYFQVAYKRIIDNVPRIIDYDFVKKLAPSIQDAFHNRFFTDDKVAAKYMAEDPLIAAEREDLEAKSGRLLEIENRLDFSVADL